MSDDNNTMPDLKGKSFDEVCDLVGGAAIERLAVKRGSMRNQRPPSQRFYRDRNALSGKET